GNNRRGNRCAVMMMGVREGRKIIKLDDVRRLIAAANDEIIVRGLGKIQQANADLKHREITRVRADGDVVEAELKSEHEIIRAAQRHAQRMIKITVRLRRIPCDGEMLVCGLPPEQIGVAENLP